MHFLVWRTGTMPSPQVWWNPRHCWILDFTPWIPDSMYIPCTWKLFAGFQSLVGFWIPREKCRIGFWILQQKIRKGGGGTHFTATAFKIACEQQTHFRSSLLSLRKIESANPRGKTIAWRKTLLANHGLALKIKELTRFTGEKCLRMRCDINLVVDFQQSHWLRGKIPAKCCPHERRNGSFFCQW